MKKSLEFLMASAVSIFIFTACSNSENSSYISGYNCEYDEFITPLKIEYSDDEAVNETSDNDEECVNQDDCATLVKDEVNDAECAASDCGDAVYLRKIGRRETENKIPDPDIYRIEGNTLYIATTGKGLMSVDISDPKNPKPLDILQINGNLGELYFKDKTAFVLVTWTNERAGSGPVSEYNKSTSKIIAVNVEDPAKLSIAGMLEIGEEIIDSKRIGDIIYLAITERLGNWPLECYNDVSDKTTVYRHTFIESVSIKDPKNPKTVEKISIGETNGESYTMYASEKSAYFVFGHRYEDDYLQTYKENYPVMMFDISDGSGKIVKKAEFSTNGFVGFKQQMYEKDNVFYAVSETSWNDSINKNVIEAFDVSDPANVRKLGELVLYQNYSGLGARFDGSRLFVTTADPDNYSETILHIIDISDPENIAELGETNSVPGAYIEVRGTKLLVFGYHNSERSIKIGLYDVSDPQNIKKISKTGLGEESGRLYDSDWKTVNISDEYGLISIPRYYFDNSSTAHHALHLVDLDLEKGLKKRGFFETEGHAKRSVVIGDTVLSIADKSYSSRLTSRSVVAADISDRSAPKIVSELILADSAPELHKCGNNLCGFKYPVFRVYDTGTKKVKWESSPVESGEGYTLMAKNDSHAYISGRRRIEDKTFNTIKVIKFKDDGIFEEVAELNFEYNLYFESAAVSENNVLAAVPAYEDEQTVVIDTDPANPELNSFEFNLTKLGERGLFTSGNIFWRNGCQYKDWNGDYDEYLCYAFPYDVSDPSEPKEKTAVNIPGTLIGTSTDGRYFYTRTPETNSYENSRSENKSDFYILWLNSDRTAACVIKKESLTEYSEYKSGNKASKSEKIYTKNDKVFFVAKTDEETVENCIYKISRDFRIRIFSAENGKSIYDKSFKEMRFASNVKDGGVMLLGSGKWIYITPDGKEKSGTTDVNIYSVGSSQLIGETVYLPLGMNNFISFDVK